MNTSASESDETFRGLVESAVEGFFIHRDFKPLFANQACADIFGYDSPEDVLALEKVLVFWAPNEQDRLKGYAATRKRGGDAPTKYEVEARRRDGSTIWVITTARRIMWQGEYATQSTVVDITEQKKLEAKVRESETRLAGIIANTGDGIISVDQYGKIRIFNPAAEAMFGYQADEIVGRDVAILMPEAERPDHKAYLDNSTMHESRIINQVRELFGQRKDGSNFPIELNVAKLDPASGDRFVGVVRDITERVEAERHQKHLATAVESLKHPIGIFDADDRLVFANRAYQEINDLIPNAVELGTFFEDHLRAVVEKGLAPDAVGREEDWIAERLAKHRNPSIQFEMHRQQDRWISVYEQRLEDGGTFLISSDITDIKRLEAQLKENEAKARDFSGIGSDWFWEMDQDLRYSAGNERWTQLTGISPGEYIGKTRKEISRPVVDEDAWVQHLEDLDAHRPIQNFVQGRLGADGKMLWMSLSGKPIFGDDGEFLGYRGVGHDITAEKAATELLELARAEAETANAAKSDFLSSMSHELRTPLNAVIGFAQILELDEDRRLNDEQKVCLRQILEGGELLLGLINDVLDLSRIETRNFSVSPERVEAGEIAASTLNMVQQLAEQYSVQVLPLTNRSTAWSHLQCDRIRTQQVLLNLLSNAIKYNRSGGTVEISIEPIDDDFARFTVTDTGRGIQVEKQDLLFEPFNRLGAESSGIEGTGIGLALSKALIELMDGRIGYQSTPGKGSSFWIDLPRDKTDDDRNTPHADEDLEAKHPVPQRTDRTILYVEYNPMNLHLMQRIVGSLQSTKLIPATTGEEGERLALHHRPDLILLDINLPGIGGLEVIRRLKANKSTASIPMLAISAAAMPGDVERGLHAGFKRYLTKPFQVREVVQAIEEELAELI